MTNDAIFLHIFTNMIAVSSLQSLAYLRVSNAKIKQKFYFSFCSQALRICCGKTVQYERLSSFLTNLHKRTLTLFLLPSFPVARSFAKILQTKLVIKEMVEKDSCTRELITTLQMLATSKSLQEISMCHILPRSNIQRQ